MKSHVFIVVVLGMRKVCLGKTKPFVIFLKSCCKKDPNNYEPWEAALMQAIGSNFDWTNKENLKPLIEFIQTKL